MALAAQVEALVAHLGALVAQVETLMAHLGALVAWVGALVAHLGALVVQNRAPEYQRSDNKALLDAALVLLDGGLLLSVVDPALLVACLISLAAVLVLLTSRHECREAHNSFEIHAVLGSSFGVQFSKRKSDERTLPPLLGSSFSQAALAGAILHGAFVIL